MKTKVSKKIGSLVLALAIAFTAVFATATPVEAATDYTTVYSSASVETATAGVEVKIPFTLTENEGIYALIMVQSQVDAQVALYDSAQNLITDWDNNPLYLYASDFAYSASVGTYAYEDAWTGSLPAGDYYYGITFAQDQNFLVDIVQLTAKAAISQTKATITKGFTKKLSVSGGKVKKWASKNKAIATVDKNGKVTAKKAGKTTITATLTNGKTVKCNVTVKDNKYSDTKLTTSDVYSGNCAMKAYSASFDSKGNLVIKTRFVNKDYYKVVALKNIKIVVKNGNGKVVGTYKLSKKSVSIPSNSTKDMTFTIKKSSLKKTKADLRNASIVCDGIYEYYY